MIGTDLELLNCYLRDRDESAFAEVVRRHVDLVYSAALRQVRSSQLAEEVSQSVFTDLARNADRLAANTTLSAWLYQVTRRTAIDVVRSEARRQLREQIAAEMNAMNATTEDWAHIEPMLDEAMQALDDNDRAAVLLRYFEHKSLSEVGQALGASEDAAQKRVGRAVERLRDFFAKRGVPVGATGLALALAANAVQAAPIGLATTITSASIISAAMLTAATATKVIAMTTLQKTLIAATMTLAIGTGIYETHQAWALRDQIQTLQQQQSVLTRQIDESRREGENARQLLADLQRELSQSRSNQTMSEILRLRGEIARMKTEAANSTEIAAKECIARINKLKQRLVQMPESGIPELRLLNEDDWLAVVANRNLDSDTDYRRALASLRGAAELKVAEILGPALDKYTKANNGQFPTDFSQLQPFFESGTLDDAILQRYVILPASTVDNAKMGGDWIITQKSAVDEEFDGRTVIGPNGYGTSGNFKSNNPISKATEEILLPVVQAYKDANNGREPISPEQVLPYATTPEQQAALKTVLDYRGTNNPAH